MLKIDQAFISGFITGNFGLEIAHENIKYDPSPQTPYAELINLPNDITPLTLNSSNHTDGIFRVILHYPVNKGTITAKTGADSILSYFSIGTSICYDGQCAKVTSSSYQKGISNDSWYRIIITIGYYAVIGR